MLFEKRMETIHHSLRILEHLEKQQDLTQQEKDYKQSLVDGIQEIFDTTKPFCTSNMRIRLYDIALHQFESVKNE